jgi:carbamate kinase
MVAQTDKNLGPIVLDHALYINQCLKDHLLNVQTYRILTQATQADADEEFNSFDKDIGDFFASCSRYLSNKEIKYLSNTLVVKDKYAYFYGTLKIHKSPATT